MHYVGSASSDETGATAGRAGAETTGDTRCLMLLPSSGCQAHCAYCFGPNRGPVMSNALFDQAIEWIAATTAPEQSLDLAFHGGEPLLAGPSWYRRVLPRLRARFGGRLELGLQSNLWLLDDELCELFEAYDVSLGTSLDGPQPINDAQRGEGYFERTMRGIETARRHGLGVGVICTFTRRSAPRYREVFDFFAREHLGIGVHAAVSALGREEANGLYMSPEEHADLFVALFDYYVENVTRGQISTFDAMARSISEGRGGICTFTDCLGRYLTIGPEGGIFSCNRFAHHPEWRLGRVQASPTLEDLGRSSPWRKLREREEGVADDCGDCPHLAYCRGGCAYNAVTGGADRRDPHCTAYRCLFDHITDRALDEVFSEENLEAVVEDGPSRHGLMREGALLQIMRGDPHPQEVARGAREVIAAVALAESDSPDEALEMLDRAGAITRPQAALESLRYLRRRLDTQPRRGLVNAYLHVTYACNLQCTHCYASSHPDQTVAMRLDELTQLVRQAAEAGFKKAVITGGEPLMHPRRDALLDTLAMLRQELVSVRIVLRTNLAYDVEPSLLERLVRSVDQVVVSVDGDEGSHDARRGLGTYRRTCANLRRLVAASRRPRSPDALPAAEVGVTAVLTDEQLHGPEARAVRELRQSLKIDIRLKSVLPLGRGAALHPTPAAYSSLERDSVTVLHTFHAVATCGLGMNLYVGPRGQCYPCYALMGERHHLGNALAGSLDAVLRGNDRYRGVTVDSNDKCRHCALRYVCGGSCRAWGSSDDPNDAPETCARLYQRARDRLVEALEVLDIAPRQWCAAGLPGISLAGHP